MEEERRVLENIALQKQREAAGGKDVDESQQSGGFHSGWGAASDDDDDDNEEEDEEEETFDLEDGYLALPRGKRRVKVDEAANVLDDEQAANDAAERAAEEALRELEAREAARAAAAAAEVHDAAAAERRRAADEAARTEALLAAFAEGSDTDPRVIMREMRGAQIPLVADRAQMTSEVEERWERENRELMEARPARLLGATRSMPPSARGDEMPPLPHAASATPLAVSSQSRATVPSVAKKLHTPGRYAPEQMLKSLAAASQKAMVSIEARSRQGRYGTLDPVLLKGSFSAPGLGKVQSLGRSPSLDALSTPLQGSMRPRTQESRPRTQGGGERPRTTLGILSTSPRTFEAIKDRPHTGSYVYKVRYPQPAEPLPPPPRTAGGNLPASSTASVLPPPATPLPATPYQQAGTARSSSPPRTTEPTYTNFESHFQTRKLPPDSAGSAVLTGGRPGAPTSGPPPATVVATPAGGGRLSPRRVVVTNAFEQPQAASRSASRAEAPSASDARGSGQEPIWSQSSRNQESIWRPGAAPQTSEHWRPMSTATSGTGFSMSGSRAGSPNGRPGSGHGLPSGGGSSAHQIASPSRSRPMSGGAAPIPEPIKGATVTSRPGSAAKRVDFSAAQAEPRSPDPMPPAPAGTPQAAR